MRGSEGEDTAAEKYGEASEMSEAAFIGGS